DFDGRIDGQVYAQPLYWRAPGAQRGLVIVASEDDRVFALDADSGRIVWRTALGPPVAGTTLPCGNIDPLGVTGTPVIDQRRGALYLDAMVDDRGTPRHRIYGLRLSDGAIMAGFPIDVAAGLAARGVRFDPAAQDQRGALTILDGRIFVPFGGHYGDCSDYHGGVVAISVEPPQLTGAWTTRAAKGGIWAPGGVSEAGGQLYFSTGNTEGAPIWLDGEAILRVGPDLAHTTDSRAFFAPSDWKELDEDDLDLGGVTPLPVTVSGNEWLLALGKDGNAYLLNRANLGGIGGAIAIQRAARGAIITAPALYPDRDAMVVVYQARGALCPNGSSVSGIGALAVRSDPSHPLSAAWCARLDGRGAPIVTTTDGRSDAIVWVAGAEGDDRLHGYRGDNGGEIFAGGGPRDGMTRLRHFATILVADEHFYIAGDGRLFAYRLPR
ncbi:MAG: PQQ-like beta-propeller repeat protein, partial [Alphaproteobacteria bacterium]|nr:PQQ-like beta-propeller repeat protein [Alphaproteobacteria bacterium]